jgi:hypothetical protein
MKRTPVILLALAALFALAAMLQHVQSRRLRAELEGERSRLLADTRRAQADAAEATRQVEAARTRAAAAAAPAKPIVAAPRPNAPANSAATAGTTAAPAAPDPEMRGVRVRNFAAEQRMQFEPLLHRLGFTAAQRQAFDRIQEKFYGAMVDEKLDAAARQQARDVRAAALRELFGDGHEAWLEANRQQSARAVVDQIIHQTFSSSGALNAAQADELTRIIGQHRRPTPGATGGAASYDWDRIIGDARTILADRQMADFNAAVSFRRASDQMSAMQAQTKR